MSFRSGGTVDGYSGQVLVCALGVVFEKVGSNR